MDYLMLILLLFTSGFIGMIFGGLLAQVLGLGLGTIKEAPKPRFLKPTKDEKKLILLGGLIGIIGGFLIFLSIYSKIAYVKDVTALLLMLLIFGYGGMIAGGVITQLLGYGPKVTEKDSFKVFQPTHYQRKFILIGGLCGIILAIILGALYLLE